MTAKAFQRHTDHSQLDELQAIFRELEKAKSKHSWDILDGNIVEMTAILAEEAGEVVRAALQLKYEDGSVEALRKELHQTAAMCLRVLEYLPPAADSISTKP